jgi:hypothetical protein
VGAWHVAPRSRPASGIAAGGHEAWPQTQGWLMLAHHKPGDGGGGPSAWHAARVRMGPDSRAPPPITRS